MPFKTTSRKTRFGTYEEDVIYENESYDKVIDTLQNLKVDISVVIEEMKKELEEVKKEYDDAYNLTLDDSLDDSAQESADDAYLLVSKKYDAISNRIDFLEDLLYNLEN